MILTKDNILRFVREKRYLTPTTISEEFDTTTTIASAALSELAKAKQVLITHLKVGSTPYYYDPLQKSAIMELAEKHLSSYDMEVYNLLKENQVLNDNSLSIQLRLAIERIKDFATPLEMQHQGKDLKFWVWYLRDINETKKQIQDALNPSKQSSSQKPQQSQIEQQAQSARNQNQNSQYQNYQKPRPQQSQTPQQRPMFNQQSSIENAMENPFQNQSEEEDSKSELFIENYFKRNYLKVENKNKEEKTIKYSLSITINKIKVYFDAIYFIKKPTEAELLKFYGSSQKPKIVFIENSPKKFFKLAKNLENFEVINI